MTKALTDAQVQSYNEGGYVFPIPVLDPQETQDCEMGPGKAVVRAGWGSLVRGAR